MKTIFREEGKRTQKSCIQGADVWKNQQKLKRTTSHTQVVIVRSLIVRLRFGTKPSSDLFQDDYYSATLKILVKNPNQRSIYKEKDP